MTIASFTPAVPADVAGGLGGATADLWLFPLDLDDSRRDALKALLSEEERQRAAAFAFPRLHDRYVASHGQMRHILSAYTGRRAQDLSIRATAEGKPFLHPEAAPAFNLSHSDGLGLLALTRDTPVGVDIERVRTSADLISIAEGSFAPAEVAALAALPAAQRTEAFFACWTRKEAIVKADGRGLGVDLAAFSVSLDPADPPRVTFDPEVFKESFRPDIRDLPVPTGYRAALATMPAIRRARLFTLPESRADW